MKKLKFIIELLEPMLATGSEGDPNSGVSLKYIPGSVLRGIVIGLSKQTGDPAKDQRDLFFNGKVRFLNSYPVENGKAGFPTPFSWQKIKDEKDESGFFDFVHKARDDKQYKDLETPFAAFDNNSSVLKINPQTRFAVHTQREVEKGFSTSGKGAVFRYESVVKGTRFAGMILCETDDLLEKIKKWINGKTIFPGGSRTAGYGKAEITVRDWNEDSNIITGTTFQVGEKFSITLLGNALIRDKNGHFQNTLTAESLGLKEDDLEPVDDKTFKKGELVGGFNRKWGLPLPQNLSIKAGSVFTFEVKNSQGISLNLEGGIGERRVEGFGQVAINLNKSQAHLSIKKPDDKTYSPIRITDERSETTGSLIIERIARRKLETKLVAVVGEAKIFNAPTNSQISRLRMAVREILQKEDYENALSKVARFFEDLKKTAQDQFNKNNMIDGKSLKNWVVEVVEKNDKIGFDRVDLGGLVISDKEKAKLIMSIHLRLIDEVLARAAKEK